MFGFGKKKKESQAPQAQVLIAPWKVRPATNTYRIPAEHEATMYTYNGMPFNGLPTNTRFIVTAVPADVQMTSIYTGTVATTHDFGDMAYAYNGQIFGFCSSHAEAVRKLLMNGYNVEVEAYISGFDGQQCFPKVRGLFGYVDDNVYRRLA